MAEEWHENLVSEAAEANDDLMEKYLEEGELTEEEIKSGLRTRTLANEIILCSCGSVLLKIKAFKLYSMLLLNSYLHQLKWLQ